MYLWNIVFIALASIAVGMALGILIINIAKSHKQKKFVQGLKKRMKET